MKKEVSKIKQCTQCKKFLSDDKFSSRKYITKEGIVRFHKRSECRYCSNKSNLERFYSNVNTFNAHQKAKFKYQCKKYGITVEQYTELLHEQNNKCYTCGIEPKDFRLNIDHCHKTGKIRKLLCHKCNHALGNANDDPNLLRKLAEYVELHA